MLPGDARVLPRDAWSTPNPPLGWTEIEAEPEHGTPVRIRNRHDPDPIWRDYEGRPIKR